MADEQTAEEVPQDDLTDDLPEEAVAILEGMPPSIRSWLLGQTQEEPPELSSAMDQIAEKINMATAFVVAQRLAHLGRTLRFLRNIEETVFTESQIKKMDSEERMKHYRTLTKDMNEFLEFTRKFTLQNKEMFNKKSQSDELAAILRELDPSVVQALMQAVSKKGAGTTINDLMPARKPVEPAKRSKVLNDLLGDQG